MLGVAEQRAYTAEMVHRHTRATPPRWGAREQKFAFVRDAVGREAAEAHVTSRHVTRIVFTGVKAEVLAQIRHHRLCRSGQTPSPGRARAIGGAVGCLRGADKPLTPAWARHSRRNPAERDLSAKEVKRLSHLMTSSAAPAGRDVVEGHHPRALRVLFLQYFMKFLKRRGSRVRP